MSSTPHPSPASPPWEVYIVRCADGTLYTGVTTDLSRRLHEHNSTTSGARYTRSRRPVIPVYREPAADRGEASMRENQIKRLSRSQKEQLIAQCEKGADPDNE